MEVNRQMFYFQQFIHMSARSALPLALARTSVNFGRSPNFFLTSILTLKDLHFLPIHQSLSLLIQFYGKSNDFSFVSFEWLGILFDSYLLGCCVNTAIVA